MKIFSRTILLVLLAGVCLVASSQSTFTRSLGLQLNPFLDNNQISGVAFKPVYALRYTLGINNRLTFGPEVSGFHVQTKSTDYAFGSFNAGAFARYSFLPESRIRPFVELSAYYTYHYWKNAPEAQYVTIPINGSKSYLSGYAAPGISLFSKSKKVSLDVFYKFSNLDLVNDKKAVLSYRLNFRF